jgi:hypothetical protein
VSKDEQVESLPSTRIHTVLDIGEERWYLESDGSLFRDDECLIGDASDVAALHKWLTDAMKETP